MGHFVIQDQWEKQVQDGRLPEGLTTDPRNSRTEKTEKNRGVF
jgi:hypothetical protein